MIDEEEFPTMFRKTLLNMIWKLKGRSEILKNNRFIYLKEHYLPRTVESLIVNKMKDDILKKSTIYQVGGQPGHSTDEHIFTIKSLMEMQMMKDSGMIFMLIDLISFFDRENILDVMSTLYDIGIPDLNKTDLPVSQIKKAVFNHHYGEIKEEVKQCKKMD